MILNNIISWGMVAMLSSLTMTTGSVDRNSTLSQNNNPASVEEATEGKGCAARITCPEGMLPFYYNHNDYSKPNVEDLSKWTFGFNPDYDCDGRLLACAICVDEDFVENGPNGLIISDEVELLTGGTATEANVSGSNIQDMPIFNRN